jgi:hypothetical protein
MEMCVRRTFFFDQHITTLKLSRNQMVMWLEGQVYLVIGATIWAFARSPRACRQALVGIATGVRQTAIDARIVDFSTSDLINPPAFRSQTDTAAC